MEKIYLSNNNLSERIESLISSGKIPQDFVETVQEALKNVRENDYLAILISKGSGVKVFGMDPAMVPLQARILEGEEIDPSCYL